MKLIKLLHCIKIKWLTNRNDSSRNFSLRYRCVQINPGAHSAQFSTNTGGYFRGNKAAGA